MEVECEKERLCGSYRLLVSVLLMLALMLCFAHQSSMGSTMICMVVDTDPDPNHGGDLPNDTDVTTQVPFHGADSGGDGAFSGGGNSSLSPWSASARVSSPSTMSSSSSSQQPGNESSPLPPYKYDWDKTTQGWIHSSLFIGYYVVQLPSGFLATRYGGKRIIIYGLLGSSVAQLLTPWAASVGVACLCVVRGLCGFTTGFIYAPVFGILANWVPAEESNLLFGLAGTGIELGTVVSFSMSALTCDLDVLGGWPLVYYFIGVAGLVTVVVFYYLVTDLPSQSRLVSQRECHHIETLIGQAGGHGHKDQDDNAPLTRSIPLRSILTSPPVWAIVISQVGSDWLYYLLITVMPSFMQEVMKMDTTTITLLTGLPFLGIIGVIYLAGSAADYVRKKNILSTSTVRKLSDFLCKIIPGGIMVSLGYLGPQQQEAFIVLYVLTFLLFAFIYMSWVTNPVDLSPVYTGFIASVSETGAMWVAIVAPIMVENMTKDKTAEEWQWVMYITGGIQVVTFIFYCIFESSELQPWGRPDMETTVVSPRGDTLGTAGADPGGQGPDQPPPTRYRSRKLISHGRVFRSPSPFLTDDSHRRRKNSVPDDFTHRTEAVPANGHARAALSSKQSFETSDIEPDYITMTRDASSDGLVPSVENSYESVHFGIGGPNGLTTDSALHSEEEDPIYENVMVGLPEGYVKVGLPDGHVKVAEHTSSSSGPCSGTIHPNGVEPVSRSQSQYGSIGAP
ncbi:hypothetical protein ACOMHN_005807 [Nucella lapillus]